MELERTGSGDIANRIRVFLGILGRRRWFVIGGLVLGAALSFVLVSGEKPMFEATASVILERTPPSVLSRHEEVVQLGVGDYWSINEYIKTQIEVLKSRRLAKRVVDRLGLDLDPVFLGVSEGVQGLSDSDRLRVLRKQDAVSLLMGRTTVTLKPDSQMLLVSVRNHDPKMAQELVNTLVEEYLQDNIDFRRRVVNEAMADLKGLMVNVRRDKEEAEARVLEFERRFGVGNLESRIDALKRRIDLLGEQAVTARMDRIDVDAAPKRMQLEEQIAETQRMLEMKDLSKISDSLLVGNSNISNLKFQIVALDVKIRELEESYGPKWPALRAAVDQRGLLRSAMQREARQLLESKLAGLVTQLQDENDKLLKVVHTEEELAREIERAKSEEAALLKIRLDYGPLTVKRDEARVLFEEISQRYARTALVSQVETNNIRVQDLAVEPSSPMPGHQKVRLLLGILIGFAVGVGLAGFVEALDSTVKTREDVEEVSGLSFLGLVPLHDYAEDELLGDAEGPSHELLLFHRPRSTVAEHIRTVRTNIFFAAPGVRPRLVVVTSPGPREGKTTLAANLGAANAMAGARTLLMDLDMRRPRLHNVFNQAKQPGLTEAYEGALDLRSVIRPTAVAGLDFLPCGAVSANPVEILESQRFRDMIDELLGIYDTVVMDSPPLLSVADAVVQSSYAQVTVLVAKAGSTAKEALREARDMLAGVVDRKVGVILNCFDVERHAYRYSYYKSKRYGYYNYYTITEETAVEASGELPARTNNERSS